ncbi:ribonucleoside-diphosphate reductase, adenosylcobalamin-dependent, partial [Candidatus Micrarchaeota archaeon]|nr:ribonucleoside-diphosphate reductase, adenosylcobalamin-dependent [Candidatus Micrarchaeota archaeon]
MNVKKIRKRDGKVVDFDKEKVVNAIFKAAQSVGGSDREEAERVADLAIELIDEKYKADEIPTVEDIQDIVEKALIERGHAATAKSYIIYRHRKNVEREMKRILGVSDDLKLPLNSVQVLERRYLLKDDVGKVMETPSQLFHRVARFIASNETRYGADEKTMQYYEQAFYQIMTSFEFLPNSPTLMNAGTNLGQLAACFVLPVEDDIPQIFDAVKYTAIIHKSGGGTGFSFSRLRPKGDFVKSTAGVASGPLSFMRIFDVATEVVKQGGKRRGANMGVLNVSHPDIEDFISI